MIKSGGFIFTQLWQIKNMKLLLPLLYVIFIFAQANFGQEWKNIIPLKSTKTDAEKILGSPIEKESFGKNGFKYVVSDGTITVYYAPEKCEGEIRGWNVEPNTVLELIFTFSWDKKGIELKKFDKSNFISFATDTATIFFADSEKGKLYVFGPERNLSSITSTPKLSDNNLRCKGFPPYNTAAASYYNNLRYPLNDINAIKNAMRLYLSIITKSDKGYVVAYSGNDMSKEEQNNYLQEIRKYILSQKEIKPNDIIIIDGGKRISSEVEMYFLPNNYPTPMPKPDF